MHWAGSSGSRPPGLRGSIPCPCQLSFTGGVQAVASCTPTCRSAETDAGRPRATSKANDVRTRPTLFRTASPSRCVHPGRRAHQAPQGRDRTQYRRAAGASCAARRARGSRRRIASWHCYAMRQLTSLDAQFLVMETPRQYGHVSGIAVLDPTTAPGAKLELAGVQKLVAERLPLLPPFRWRLAEVPFGLDYPYWIDDPDFDLDFHVRELALPQPGTVQKLTDQVVRIFARPLDRSRPLWELYLIHGLAGGRVAILTKIHHPVVDGKSRAEIPCVLLDIAPEGRDAPPDSTKGTTQMPGQLEMLGRGLAGLPRYPLRVLESLPRALPNIEEVAIYDAIPGARELGRLARGVRQALRLGGDDVVVEREQGVPPRTSFNRRVSAHPPLAIARPPLGTGKEIKNHYGCTANDVPVSSSSAAVLP